MAVGDSRCRGYRRRAPPKPPNRSRVAAACAWVHLAMTSTANPIRAVAQAHICLRSSCEVVAGRGRVRSGCSGADGVPDGFGFEEGGEAAGAGVGGPVGGGGGGAEDAFDG